MACEVLESTKAARDSVASGFRLRARLRASRTGAPPTNSSDCLNLGQVEEKHDGLQIAARKCHVVVGRVVRRRRNTPKIQNNPPHRRSPDRRPEQIPQLLKTTLGGICRVLLSSAANFDQHFSELGQTGLDVTVVGQHLTCADQARRNFGRTMDGPHRRHPAEGNPRDTQTYARIFERSSKTLGTIAVQRTQVSGQTPRNDPMLTRTLLLGVRASLGKC